MEIKPKLLYDRTAMGDRKAHHHCNREERQEQGNAKFGCVSVWGRVLWDQFTIGEYACPDSHEGRMTDR